MSWGQAAEGASTAGDSASLYGNMADAGGSASSAPSSGFTIEPANTGGTMQGPTVEAGNMQTYGTTDPSIMQQAGNTLDRFQKGGNQNLADTYKNFGNNAETYGAAYGMMSKMAGSGKPASGAAPITTNISYQQPANPYLQKRGRY